jgi:hypothetical protein
LQWCSIGTSFVCVCVFPKQGYCSLPPSLRFLPARPSPPNGRHVLPPPRARVYIYIWVHGKPHLCGGDQKAGSSQHTRPIKQSQQSACEGTRQARESEPEPPCRCLYPSCLLQQRAASSSLVAMCNTGSDLPSSSPAPSSSVSPPPLTSKVRHTWGMHTLRRRGGRARTAARL